jgi:hypothetical protein
MPGKHHALLDLPLHLSPRRRLIVGIALALLVFAAIGFRTGASRHRPAQPMPTTSPSASASAEPSPSSAPSGFARVASPSTVSPSASRSARRTQTPAAATTAPCTVRQYGGFGPGGGYRAGAGCPGQVAGPGYPPFGGGGGPGGGGFGGFGR